jgi:hypothetical protein
MRPLRVMAQNAAAVALDREIAKQCLDVIQDGGAVAIPDHAQLRVGAERCFSLGRPPRFMHPFYHAHVIRQLTKT